jgi:hypothetical protein
VDREEGRRPDRVGRVDDDGRHEEPRRIAGGQQGRDREDHDVEENDGNEPHDKSKGEGARTPDGASRAEERGDAEKDRGQRVRRDGEQSV